MRGEQARPCLFVAVIMSKSEVRARPGSLWSPLCPPPPCGRFLWNYVSFAFRARPITGAICLLTK